MTTINKAASLMGKASYRARLRRLGIERIREIARQNGRKGGRPPKKPAGGRISNGNLQAR
jgi:hypothetical protein